MIFALYCKLLPYKTIPLKNTLFSIGFTLVIGCHVTADNTASPQPETATTAPQIVFQPLAKDDSLRYYNAVKSFFEKSLISNRNFNGGILVAKGESIIYEQYKGYKDMQTKEPLDATSPMHIASAS